MEEQSKITEAQYNALKRQIGDIAKTIDVKFQQWDEDRKTITDVLVVAKTIVAKLEGARDDIADDSKKMISEVKEHLSPMPDIVSESISTAIADNLENKKVIRVNGLGFFKRIRLWLRQHLGI